MKMRYLAIVFLFFATLIVSAQDDAESSAMAKEILDKMAENNKKYSTIDATFTLTIEDKKTKKQTEHKGSLTTKGNKYKLCIMNTETYFDGTDIYAWNKDAAEVTISEPDENDESAVTPAKILGSYEVGYKMRYVADAKVGGVDCYEIDLYPENLNNTISRIRIDVDMKTYNIKSLMQQGKDGTSYYVKIDSFVTDSEIADSVFKFDATNNPDVEVIDMR